MPLINCPDCDREISPRSAQCVGCGCPQSAFPKPDAPKVEVAPEKPAPARVTREAEAPSSPYAKSDPVQARFSDRPLTDRGETPALIDAFIRGFDFESRTSRSDYWRAFFTALVLTFALAAVDVASGVGVLSSLFVFVWLIPWFALNARRLHDVGYSGWYLLWVLTGVGLIAVLYWQAQPSGEADRRFKEVVEPDQPPRVGRGDVAPPQAERAQDEDYASLFWFAFLIAAMSVGAILGLAWIIKSS